MILYFIYHKQKLSHNRVLHACSVALSLGRWHHASSAVHHPRICQLIALSTVELQSQLEDDLQTRNEGANFAEAACGHHLIVFLQSCMVVSGLLIGKYAKEEGRKEGMKGGDGVVGDIIAGQHRITDMAYTDSVCMPVCVCV